MDKLMLLLPVSIIYATVVLLLISRSRPQGSLLFGLTFPPEHIKDERLRKLQSDFRREARLFALLAFLAALPLIWFGGKLFLGLIYMMLWTWGILYGSAAPFRKANDRAARLKREQGWFVDKQHMVRIDKDIERLASNRPASAYWFIVPLLSSISLMIVSLRNGIGSLELAGFASLGMTGVMFALYFAFSKGKLRAYSRNATVNLALNWAAKRRWSLLWLALAGFEAVIAWLAYAALSDGTALGADIWLAGILLVSIVPLLGIYAVHHHIRDLEYRYADTDGVHCETDADSYWRNGLVYCNPHDKALFVPKRFGAGMTVNVATRAGKLLYYGSFVLVAAIVIPILALMLYEDTASPRMALEADGFVAITDTKYPFRFALDDIVELDLTDKAPSGFRSNGIATAEFARGNFKLSELGAAKMYIYKKSPPYIVIKLDEWHVVFNERDAADTRALYEAIVAEMNANAASAE